MSGEYLLNNVQSGVYIDINVGGELVVEGQTIAEITARGDEPNIIGGQNGERVTVECDGDCWLHVPESAVLTIGHVDGAAKVSGIQGLIKIDQVDGDLTLQDVGGDVQISNVDGDLLIMRAGGSVKVDNISGRAKFQKIMGP